MTPLFNTLAREGCDRCECGCKYWEHDRCIDCGTPVQEAQTRAANRRYEGLRDQRDLIEALRRQLRAAQAVLVEMEHDDLHPEQGGTWS